MALAGERFELKRGEAGYPPKLEAIGDPPDVLYGIGSPDALKPGLAVIGARKATPYGLGCARRFASRAAEKGVVIISGGARGCDSEAHRAALEAHGLTVAVLGGGCDKLYPSEHFSLFQSIIDAGGAVISEHSWDVDPKGFCFRARNRIIAGLSEAVLIVEAGLPSGTFSTADNALDYGRDVLVVPGAITSYTSRGSNRLLLQGAVPVVDDDSFDDALFHSLGMLKAESDEVLDDEDNPIVAAVRSAPSTLEELYVLACKVYGEAQARERLMSLLAEAEACGTVARQPDGTWGPAIRATGHGPRRRRTW